MRMLLRILDTEQMYHFDFFWPSNAEKPGRS